MREVSFLLPYPTGEVGALVKQEVVLLSLQSGSLAFDILKFSLTS